MVKKVLILGVVLAMVVWVAGCSDNPSSTNTTEPTTTSDAFGGFTASPEQPGFGDSELLASEDGEEAVDDPMLSSAAVQSIVNDVEYGMFHFRAVWGQLEYDSTVTEVTDWSGSLTITAGAEVIRRVIRFEPATDYIVPRTDRKLIEWVSVTTTHNDGIGVDIYVPPQHPTYDTIFVDDGQGGTTMEIDTVPPTPVTVTFNAGTYARTFSLAELAALDEVVDFDNGTALSLHANQYVRNTCARGMLAGFWGYDDEGNPEFKGIWFSNHGYVAGYLMGTFGTDEETGTNVYYGKWIDLSGQFEGLLRGTWGYHANTRAAEIARRRGGGWFEGKIYDANGVEAGAMAGLFRSMPQVDAGWFAGRWKIDCPQDNEVSATNSDKLNDGF